MKPLHPRIGSLVAYKLTQADVDQVNRRRADAQAATQAGKYTAARRPDGAQLHVGTTVAAGDVLPLIVTRTARLTGNELSNLDDQIAATFFKQGIDARAGVEVINGQVQLDGNDTLWVTNRFQSYNEHDGQPNIGCWARLMPAPKTTTLPTVRALGIEATPTHATPTHKDGVA